MEITDAMEYIPFAQLLGIEITVAEDGHAEGQLELTSELSSNPGHLIAHGGVAYALADTVGGAAVVSLNFIVTPTIDMRIDYLNPATSDLYAEADVLRNGDSVAVADISVSEEGGTDIATARGVYKTGEHRGPSPWTTDDEEFTRGKDE